VYKLSSQFSIWKKNLLSADDTNLFVSPKTINELDCKASFYLKILNNLLNANRLHLSTDKTQWRSNAVSRVGKVQGAPECRSPRVPGKKITNNFPVQPVQ